MKSLRFSLRQLILALTLASGVLVLMAPSPWRTTTQSRIVAAILASGGHVFFAERRQADTADPNESLTWKSHSNHPATTIAAVKLVKPGCAKHSVVYRLAELHGLRQLTIHNGMLDKRAVEVIAQCEDLESIALIDTPFPASSMPLLMGLGKLKTLTLGGKYVGDVHLLHLRRSRSLQSVQLVNAPVTERGLRALLRVEGLKHLVLRDLPHVRPQSLAWVFQTPRLESLSLQDLAMDDSVFTEIPTQSQLRSLQLKGLSITDSSIACLTRLPCLTNCDLRVPRLTNNAVHLLRGHKRLERLRLQLPDVTDEALADLVTCSALTELVLAETQITDRGLLRLREMSQLKRLRVSTGGGVTMLGLKRVKRHLPRCDMWFLSDAELVTIAAP